MAELKYTITDGGSNATDGRTDGRTDILSILLFSCVKVLATVVTEETYYLDLFALFTLATRLPAQPALHCPVVQKQLPPGPLTLWTLPQSSWPSNQPLPNFCTFGFYMFNHDTGKRLLQASQTLPPPPGRDHFQELVVELVCQGWGG